MTDAMERLLEALEAGRDAPFHDLTYSQLDTFGQRSIDLIQQANRGDLNAAKALHDTMLPGWKWGLGPASTCVWQEGSEQYAFTAEAGSVAAAWLLAILRAKLAENHPRQETSD